MQPICPDPVSHDWVIERHCYGTMFVHGIMHVKDPPLLFIKCTVVGRYPRIRFWFVTLSFCLISKIISEIKELEFG